MRFFLSRLKPDTGAIFMSTYEPERVEMNDVVDFRFKKLPVVTSEQALSGLGVRQFPEPGNCIRVTINSADSEAEGHMKEVFEEN